jgi:hypothetical protein
MRGFALLLALALTAAVLYCAYLVTTTLRQGTTRRSQEKATWKVRHYSHDGATVVAVSLTAPGGDVLDDHVVARFPDEDPDWQNRFLHARQEAEERAFHLNTPD